ncbi:hypothetical protein Nmel_008533 [Mimus melanotis]
MSTETHSNCPICQDTCEDVASTLRCHHQFCLGCILRWTQRNPVCSLCRRTVVTVRFSDHGEDDYLETSITVPEELPDGSSQAERDLGSLDENSSHPPLVYPSFSPQGTMSPAEQEGSGLEFVGSVLPEVWAEIFHQRQHLLDPIRPWLHERLEGIYQGWWWVGDAIESSILHGLCIYGSNAEILVEVLQPLLEEHTAPLVRGVISIIMGQCREALALSGTRTTALWPVPAPAPPAPAPVPVSAPLPRAPPPAPGIPASPASATPGASASAAIAPAAVAAAAAIPTAAALTAAAPTAPAPAVPSKGIPTAAPQALMRRKKLVHGRVPPAQDSSLSPSAPRPGTDCPLGPSKSDKTESLGPRGLLRPARGCPTSSSRLLAILYSRK